MLCGRGEKIDPQPGKKNSTNAGSVSVRPLLPHGNDRPVVIVSSSHSRSLLRNMATASMTTVAAPACAGRVGMDRVNRVSGTTWASMRPAAGACFASSLRNIFYAGPRYILSLIHI